MLFQLAAAWKYVMFGDGVFDGFLHVIIVQMYNRQAISLYGR